MHCILREYGKLCGNLPGLDTSVSAFPFTRTLAPGLPHLPVVRRLSQCPLGTVAVAAKLGE